MDATLRLVRDNLFPGSHEAIADWERFPWHRDLQGQIQTHKVQSSQALAIDVFGTIKVSNDRDRIITALALSCGIPGEGPWTLDLEWTDPDNMLREPTPTQVDAIAFGKRGLLVFECKFTEVGGGCSQPLKISKGANRGLRQCNGSYSLQTNPVNGRQARCALSAKGVRYWEIIPQLFGLNAEQDYNSCPFRGDSYQWMRNVVLASQLASTHGISGAVLAAYADGKSFPTAQKVASGFLGHPAVSGQRLISPISYQSIVELARSVAEPNDQWEALHSWIDRKIRTVDALSSDLSG